MKTIKNVCLIAAMSLFIISCEKDTDVSEIDQSIEQNELTSDAELASKAPVTGAVNELQFVNGFTAFVFCDNRQAGVQDREVAISRVWRGASPKIRTNLNRILASERFRICKIRRIARTRR